MNEPNKTINIIIIIIIILPQRAAVLSHIDRFSQRELVNFKSSGCD